MVKLLFVGILRRTDGKSITIVIKELKNNAHSEVKEDFIREIEIMSNSRHHNNILKLIGIFPQGNGDLKCINLQCHNIKYMVTLNAELGYFITSD